MVPYITHRPRRSPSSKPLRPSALFRRTVEHVDRLFDATARKLPGRINGESLPSATLALRFNVSPSPPPRGDKVEIELLMAAFGTSRKW
jgi:hypothetical protein